MRKHERASVVNSAFSVTIHVGEAVAYVGGTIKGHIEPHDTVGISLVRFEDAGEVTQQAKAASSVSDSETGAFELIVPRDAVPTVNGQSVNVKWRIRADRHLSIPIEVQRDPQATFTNFYASGEAPRVMTELSRRSHEIIYTGAMLFVLFAGGFFYIEAISRDASTFGRAAAIGAIVAAALASLAASLLAAGPAGAEPSGVSNRLSLRESSSEAGWSNSRRRSKRRRVCASSVSSRMATSSNGATATTTSTSSQSCVNEHIRRSGRSRVRMAVRSNSPMMRCRAFAVLRAM